jgi:hypothetical protein
MPRPGYTPKPPEVPPPGLVPVKGERPGYYLTETGELWSYLDRGRLRSPTWHRLRVQPAKAGRTREGTIYYDYPSVTLYDGTDNQGHRRIKRRFLHRMMIQTFICRGPIPDGLVARHLDGDWRNWALRDSQGKIRLAVGTRAENEADTARLDRYPVGERHPNHKLRERDVHEIKALRSQGYTWLAIGQAIGCSQTWARKCGLGLAWPHVQRGAPA